MAVTSRRKAREVALRTLYEIDLGHAKPLEAIEGAFEEIDLTEPLREFVRAAVEGIRVHRAEIDQRLDGFLKGYDMGRLAVVDRNILRLAAFELIYLAEMPPAVTINEAIEIAKRYSTADSGKFVNGVLGKLVLDTPKANWEAPIVVDEAPEEPDEIEIEEIEITEDSPEAKQAKRLGAWTIRSDSSDVEAPHETSIPRND